MPNMTPTKTPIKEQDPKVRARNFKEVTLGYTPEEAKNEAARCLNCKNRPCMSGCPVSVRIPEFIAKVAAGEFEEAYLGIYGFGNNALKYFSAGVRFSSSAGR